MLDLKNLFTDEDAVSPVIGVILMVAITVILAAVIGAFVLNIGGNQETAPQASLSADYSPSASTTAGFESGTPTVDGDEIAISHDGGGTFDASQLSANVDGTTVDDLSASSSPIVDSNEWSSGTSAGDTITFVEITDGTTDYTFTSGGDVSITWTSSSGENSQVIFESTIP